MRMPTCNRCGKEDTMMVDAPHLGDQRVYCVECYAQLFPPGWTDEYQPITEPEPDLYKRLVEQIEHYLNDMTKSHGAQAKRACIQRARGVWDFGQYLIHLGELRLDQTQADNYIDLDRMIFGADHGLDGQ